MSPPPRHQLHMNAQPLGAQVSNACQHPNSLNQQCCKGVCCTYTAQTSKFWELRPAQASSVGNPVRGMLLGRFRGTGGLPETQRRPGRRPACTAWCNQTGAHRLPASFIPAFTGANTEPRGSSGAPVAFRGATAAGRAGTPSSPVTYLPQWGRRDSRCPRPQGSRGAGRGWRPGAPGCRAEENPGTRAQATESQARSRSGASGDVRAQEPSAGWSWGCCRWGWSRRLGPELGRD